MRSTTEKLDLISAQLESLESSISIDSRVGDQLASLVCIVRDTVDILKLVEDSASSTARDLSAHLNE